MIADILFKKDKYKEAIECWDQLIIIAPKYYYTY